MIAEEIVARLRVDAGQWAAGMATAQGSLTSLQASARKTGASMQSSGRSMMTGLTLPLVGIGIAGLKTAADFERSMNTFQVAAGDLPDSEMKAFSDLAMKMGAETEFSAKDAADAMLELAKGGMDPAIISGGALQATMALASAGGLDLATAATTTSNAMNMFGLKGDQASAVADSLAGAANASSANVSDLTMALSQVGTSAAASGLSIQETTAILAKFADAGIKGSDAGTSLKTFLSRLNPITAKAATMMDDLGMSFYDANGNMKNAAQIQQTLRTGLAGMTQEERQHAIQVMFGSDAQRAANILYREGKKDLSDYTAATSESGNAQKMSEARMKGLAGALERMRGSLETAGKAIGDALAPAITVAAAAIEKFANFFTSLPGPVQTAAASFGVFLAALGPVVWMGGKLVSAFAIMRGGLTSVMGAFGTAGGAASRFTGALTGTTAAQMRAAQASAAAAAGARGYAATATAASRASVRITTTTTGAAVAMGRYTATAGAAATANTRVAASGGGAAASMTRMSGALGGIGAAAVGITTVVTAVMMLNQASADTAMAVEQMVDRIVAGENLLASGADIQGTQGGLAAFFLDQERTINDVLNRVAKSQFERFTEGTGQINADDAALTNYIQAIGQYASQNLPAARQQYEQLVQAFQQRGMDTGMLDPLRDKLTALGVSAQSSAGDVRGLGQSMSGLNRAAANAQWQSQFASMRQGLAGAGASWMTMKGQVLQTAAAQQQARDAAVQAAGAGTAGAQRATAAYQRQVVQIGSLVPKSQQAGGAFKALAQSAGMGANQLRAAVGKYRAGGMNAAQALAAGLRRGAGPARNAGNATGKAGANGLAAGVKSGAGKARGAGGVAGAAAAAGLKGQGGKVQGAGRSTGGKGPDGVVNGIRSSMGKSVQAAIQMMTTVSSTIQGMGPVVYSAGSYVGTMVGQGLVDGMNSMLGAVQAAASEIASAVDEAIRKKAEIESPSKVQFRNGKAMVAGLVKGLGAKGADATRAANKLSDGIMAAFRSRVADMKQAAQRIVDYIRQVRATMNTFAAASAFDASGAQSQAEAYQSAKKEAKAASDAQVAAQAEVTKIQAQADRAARDIAKWDAAGNHYRVATALDAQKTATEKLAEANEKLATATGANSDAQAALATTARGGVAAGSVVADMRKRVQLAEAFRDNLVKLRNKGLNTDTLREFAEAGPEAAGATVAGLAGGVKANIAAINGLQNRAGSAARTVGDLAGVAKYGAGGTFAPNQAVLDSGLKVEKGAVVLNFDAAMSKADKREMQRIANEALTRAMDQLAREIKQKKKTK